jgi:hypothetical protein
MWWFIKPDHEIFYIDSQMRQRVIDCLIELFKRAQIRCYGEEVSLQWSVNGVPPFETAFRINFTNQPEAMVEILDDLRFSLRCSDATTLARSKVVIKGWKWFSRLQEPIKEIMRDAALTLPADARGFTPAWLEQQ